MSGLPPTRPPAAPAAPRVYRRRAAGFTLVELLTVIVIIAILASITLSISNVVLRKQSESRCQSQMRVITVALQSFKEDNGDFPPMENSRGSGSPYAEENLLMALTGHARWTTSAATGKIIWETVEMGKRLNDGSTVSNGNGEKYTWGHEYIELAKYSYDHDNSTDSNVMDNAVLYDPWFDGTQGDDAYLYRYKKLNDVDNPPSNWQSKTYLLISRGPDGLPANADDSFVWKTVNGHTQFSGFLVDDYSDPVAHPGCADNFVEGSTHLP